MPEIRALAIGGVADGQMIEGDAYSRMACIYQPNSQQMLREIINDRPMSFSLMAVPPDPHIDMPFRSVYKLEVLRLEARNGQAYDYPLWVEHGHDLAWAMDKIFNGYRPVPFVTYDPNGRKIAAK